MAFVDDDEEAFSAGEDGAFGVLQLGLVEEFATFAVEVAADEDERVVQRGWAQVVDLKMTGHGEDVEGAVELAHGLVEEGGDDASVDVAGRAFVVAGELNGGGTGEGDGVGGEVEVKAFGVGGTASEAVAGALVDGGAVGGGFA